ncbi:MAG: hypothetical protein AABN33_11510 [Acidobacteriota bacterium]
MSAGNLQDQARLVNVDVNFRFFVENAAEVKQRPDHKNYRVYYSAQILFFGAEFTQVYANKYGSRIKPDKDAVPVTEKARSQQGMRRRKSR